MDTQTETFLDTLDNFAEGLSTYDQTLLRALLGDEPPEVEGFAADGSWPGVRNVAPMGQLTTQLEKYKPFLSSGHCTGSNLLSGPISGGDLGSGR